MSTSPKAPKCYHLQVTDSDSGLRLDQFLAAAAPEHSRSRWQRAIDAGRVRVNGRAALAGLRLSAGQEVEADEPEAPPSTLAPEPLDLRIVFEDPDLLVVDKPAGLVVHPGAGRWTGTLANALVHRYGNLPAGSAERPGIVHRLDKDTSGLLIVALSERAHRALSQALAERTVERSYWAMVWGDPGERGEYDAPIGRDPRARVKMAVVPGGREARTTFERRAAYGFASELRVRLKTGRTHQIRVHFAHSRHAVVGDEAYGGLEPPRGAPPRIRPALAAASRTLSRQALHAASLRFKHPAGDAILEFDSPLPADLEALRAAFQSLRDRP